MPGLVGTGRGTNRTPAQKYKNGTSEIHQISSGIPLFHDDVLQDNALQGNAHTNEGVVAVEYAHTTPLYQDAASFTMAAYKSSCCCCPAQLQRPLALRTTRPLMKRHTSLNLSQSVAFCCQVAVKGSTTEKQTSSDSVIQTLPFSLTKFHQPVGDDLTQMASLVQGYSLSPRGSA